MKKRIVSILLALVLCVGLLPVMALGAEIVASGECGAQGDNVTWTLDSEGTLTISGEGEMADFGQYSAPWSDYWPVIRKASVRDGVTRIGGGSFNYCTGLTSLTLPESIAEISVAFCGCSQLREVIYNGTETNWASISVAQRNTVLLNAQIVFSGNNEESSDSRFADVPIGSWFNNAIQWAVKEGITNGTSETTFSPSNGCTRGQVATFLWRAFGSPEPESSKTPFTDIKADDYYYTPTIWAVENEVTNGTAATSFSPERICTRGQAVTFLWRATGSPEPENQDNPFKDVQESAYYYKAVLWAVEHGITQGTDAFSFSPNHSCSRAHIVTFLYRLREDMAGEIDWKKAYLDFIESHDMDDFNMLNRYCLTYIDNDDIPELYIMYTPAAAGAVVCTFNGSVVVTQPLSRGNGISVIEKSGLLRNHGSGMNWRSDAIYTLQNHRFSRIAVGSYAVGLINEPLFSNFQWNRIAVSEEEYYNHLNAVFDTTVAIKCLESSDILFNDEVIRFLKEE